MESQNKSLFYRLSRSSSSSHLTLHPTHCRSFVCSYIPATNQLPKSVLKKNRFRDKPYFHSPPCLIALSSLYRFHRFCSRPLSQDRLLKSVLRKVFFFTKVIRLTGRTAPQGCCVSPFLARISVADGHLQVCCYLTTKFRNRFCIKTNFTKNRFHFSPLCVLHPASPNSVLLPSVSHSSPSCFYSILH